MMSKSPDPTANILDHLYNDLHMSVQTIGTHLGIPQHRITTLLKQAGIPRRQRLRSDIDADEVKRLYDEGKSGPEIAALLNTSHGAIYRRLSQLDIPRRPMTETGRGPRLHTRREASKFWKGGRIVTSDGYIGIRKPDPIPAGEKPYEYEHRLVWEKANGRKLRPNEVVHHINGDRQDNRPENLVALTISEHMRHHADERREHLSEIGRKGAAKRWHS